MLEEYTIVLLKHGAIQTQTQDGRVRSHSHIIDLTVMLVYEEEYYSITTYNNNILSFCLRLSVCVCVCLFVSVCLCLSLSLLSSPSFSLPSPCPLPARSLSITCPSLSSALLLSTHIVGDVALDHLGARLAERKGGQHGSTTRKVR